MTIRDAWGLLRKTIKEWNEDRAMTHAAALAYYATFSIAPLLLVAIAVAGLVFDRATVQQYVVAQVQGLAGRPAGELITDMIEARSTQGNILAVAVGAAAILFGASAVFGRLQEALNLMWDVRHKRSGLLRLIKDRVFSFAMVISVGFLLLVSLVLSAGLAALSSWLGGLAGGLDKIVLVFGFALSFAIVTSLFALVFKYVPDAEVEWHDVWLGAAFTAAFFSLGKVAIGIYLGRSTVSAQFGAAGALVVMLLWIYYSALICFLGAEFTQVYANRFGGRVVPDENAEPMRKGPAEKRT